MNNNNNGDLNVEAMRGVAAMIVAYFHCRVIAWIGIHQYATRHSFSLSPDSLLAYVTFPFVFGSIGVPIFFVISGYCIHRQHAQKFALNPAYRLDWRNFLLRRFVRIYPVLLAALLLTLILDSFSLQFSPLNERLGDLSLTTFIANLCALQGVIAPPYGSNGALWTLSLEIQFYALYPLLLMLRRRIGSTATLLALIVLTGVSYVMFERHLVIVFASYWASWYLGAWVAELQVAGVQIAKRRLYVASVVLLLAGCAVSFRSQYGAFQLWALAFAPALFAMVTGTVARSATRVVRMLAKVGEFSYSLYIVHLPVFVLLTSALFHSRKPDSILYSIGFFFVAFAVAWVFHLVVEQPVLRLLKVMSVRRAGRQGIGVAESA